MTSEILYKGNLRTAAKHLYSGSTIETDAPLDNKGLAERFSPTDLVATALGSCMLTIMGIAANTHGIDISETKVSVEKIMAAEPRRIGGINITFSFAKHLEFSDKERKILEHAALTCPVFYSLAEAIDKNIKFEW